MVMKLALKVLRLTQHQAPEQFQVIWEADTWVSLKSELDGCKRFEKNSGLSQICEQMIRAMANSNSNSNPKHKKRKLPDVQSIPEIQEKRRKKPKGDV